MANPYKNIITLLPTVCIILYYLIQYDTIDITNICLKQLKSNHDNFKERNHKMKNFESLVEQYGEKICCDENSYSPAGKLYHINNDYWEGRYWYYESNKFVIDTYDLYIKKDYIENNMKAMSDYICLISNYIISVSGEWLNPYRAIEPYSMFIMDTNKPARKYVLHGNSRLHMVGMKFKRSMFNEHLLKKLDLKAQDVAEIFVETQRAVTNEIGKIAEGLLRCRMKEVPAEIFFEAKAQEWLSITLNAYEDRIVKKTLTKADDTAIENVARYIEDHYSLHISQKFLEKMSAMSGTKLKSLFKEKYKMTITEFTQRKRMNIAENLLLSTDLPISNIAQSVGYNSFSRFSTLFKRYKGIYPKDVKKIVLNPYNREL